MCNVVSKTAIILAAAALLGACSKKDEAKEEATALVQTIMDQMEAGNYDLALSLMDTVDSKYANQVDLRSQITALRPRAIEQSTMIHITEADSLRLDLELQLEEMAPLMKHISGDGLEGYYVVANAHNANFINSTGIEPRVNDSNLTFYLVANSQGKPIGINQIALNTASEEFLSEQIPASSARVDVIEGSEIASFLAEEVATLGEWAWNHQYDVKGAMICGRKGNQKVKLTPAQAAAFGTAWRYADLKQKYRNAQMLRERLERRLQIARDQAANKQDF